MSMDMRIPIGQVQGRQHTENVPVSRRQYVRRRGYPMTRKLTVQELLFYVYFALMLVLKGTGFTDGPVYRAAILASVVLVYLRIALGGDDRRQYMMVIALTALMCIVYWRTRNESVLFVIPALLCVEGIPMRDLFRFGGIFWGISFVFQAVTQLLNLRTRDFVIHHKFGLGYAFRWALGYSHPNVLMVAYTALIMYLFWYCRGGRHLRRWILTSFFFALFFFLYSFSITGILYYSSFILILGAAEIHRRSGLGSGAVLRAAAELLLPLCVLFSLVVPVVTYPGKIYQVLNKLMTTRPLLTHYFLTHYGLNLFGLRTDGIGRNLTLDCSYANLLIYSGSVLFAVLIGAYCVTIVRTCRMMPSYERSLRLSILLSTAVGMTSEPFGFNTAYKNTALFLVGEMLYEVTRGRGEHAVQAEGAVHQESGISVAWSASENITPRKKSSGSISRLSRQHNVPDLPAAAEKAAGSCARLFKRAGRLGLALGAVGAAVGILLAASLMRLPSHWYAFRSSIDIEGEEEPLFLTAQQAQSLRENTDVRVMEYKDEETPMQELISPGGTFADIMKANEVSGQDKTGKGQESGTAAEEGNARLKEKGAEEEASAGVLQAPNLNRIECLRILCSAGLAGVLAGNAMTVLAGKLRKLQ